MNKITVKNIIYQFEYDNLDVNILWIEYSGGGMSYEFEIVDSDGRILHASEDGYGQALPAAAAAYQHLQDSDDE